MKCAAVFVFISGVLRTHFPTKATPPFRGDIITIGDEMNQQTAETGPALVPK